MSSIYRSLRMGVEYSFQNQGNAAYLETRDSGMSMPLSRTANEKFCTDCGSLINARAEICPKCGVRQLPAPGVIGVTTPGGKNRIAAALFALLLGGVGIHKF